MGVSGNYRPSLYPSEILVWKLGRCVGNPSLKTVLATLWWPLFSWDRLGGATSVPEEAASECLLWVIEWIAWGTVF